jgi:hypothetical protein
VRKESSPAQGRDELRSDIERCDTEEKEQADALQDVGHMLGIRFPEDEIQRCGTDAQLQKKNKEFIACPGQ